MADERKTLAAWTPEGANPPYFNITKGPDGNEVTVRSPADQQGGQVTAMAVMRDEELIEFLCDALFALHDAGHNSSPPAKRLTIDKDWGANQPRELV